MWMSCGRVDDAAVIRKEGSRGPREVSRQYVNGPVPPTPHLLTDPRLRAAYAEGAGVYRIVPQAVVLPRDPAELAGVLRWAAETGTPLVPRGSGSGMPGGNLG